MSVTLACRKDRATVNGKDARDLLHQAKGRLGATAKGEPIEVPGGLGVDRQYFQSRSPITLKIALDDIAQGDRLSLVDETTSAKLIDGQSVSFGLTTPTEATTLLLDGEDGGQALSGFAAHLTGAFDMTIRLYPLDPAFQGKLGYGDNRLRVDVESNLTTQTAKNTVRRWDAAVFEAAYAASDTPGQRRDGLEVDLMPFGSSAVSNGESWLTSGSIYLFSE